MRRARRAATLLTRAAAVVAASGGAALLGLAATLLLARTYPADAFGLFAILISAFSLLAPLAGWGADRLLLRSAVGGDTAAVATLLRGGVAAVLATAVGAALACAAAAPLFDAPHTYYALGAVGLLAATLRPLAIAVHQAEHRDYAVAGWELLAPLGRLFAAAVAAATAAPLIVFFALFAAVEGVVTAAALGVVARYRRRQPPSPAPRPALSGVLRAGAPFAASGVFYAIYYQSDVLMVGALIDLEAAGLYKAAFVWIAAAYLLPAAAIQRFLLPRIYRWRWQQPPPWQQLATLTAAAVAFGSLVALALVGFAAPLITAAYGSDYRAAVPLLQLLALVIPFHCLAMAVGAFLLEALDLRRKVAAQFGLALLNVGLNALLIPALGVLGAVVATLTTEVALAAAYTALLLVAFRGRAGLSHGVNGQF